MDLRTFTCLLSVTLALFICINATAARNSSLAELREQLKNTTGHKCWCKECKSANETHLSFERWWKCFRLMKTMFLNVGYDDFYYDSILQSTPRLMRDPKDFCVEPITLILNGTDNSSIDGPISLTPGMTTKFAGNLTTESCLHFLYSKRQQTQAENNHLVWIVPLLVAVLLVNIIGVMYFYFRFRKIESFQRFTERKNEASIPLDSFNNTALM